MIEVERRAEQMSLLENKYDEEPLTNGVVMQCVVVADRNIIIFSWCSELGDGAGWLFQ